jgi:hypothetical protein
VILIIGFLLVVWWFMGQFDIQNRALDAIEAFNQYGLATSYMCPEGYEVK